MIQDNHHTHGLLGFILAFLSPWIGELGLIVQTLAGILGLVLLIHAIRHKRLEIKKLKKEIDDYYDAKKP